MNLKKATTMLLKAIGKTIDDIENTKILSQDEVAELLCTPMPIRRRKVRTRA